MQTSEYKGYLYQGIKAVQMSSFCPFSQLFLFSTCVQNESNRAIIQTHAWYFIALATPTQNKIES